MKMRLLTRGVADCKIVLPENMTVVEKTAADELGDYIEKTFSVTLPVVTENKADGKCIYVGHTEYAKNEGVFGKSRENWIIAVRNGSLILTGGKDRGDRGVLYAVYHFLDKLNRLVDDSLDASGFLKSLIEFNNFVSAFCDQLN